MGLGLGLTNPKPNPSIQQKLFLKQPYPGLYKKNYIII